MAMTECVSPCHPPAAARPFAAAAAAGSAAASVVNESVRNKSAAAAAAGGGGGQEGEIMFLVDSMLGRLSRWLRVLGVDVEFHDFNLPSILSHKGASSLTNTCKTIVPALAGTPPPILAKAHRTGRVVLTRDKRLAESRHNTLLGVRTFLIKGNDTRQQLEQVVRWFGIRLDPNELMSRCSGCNAKGYVALTPEEVAGREDVPERVKENVETFWTCVKEGCEKLYWKGEMWNKASSKFSIMIEEMMLKRRGWEGGREGEGEDEEEEEEDEEEEQEEEEED